MANICDNCAKGKVYGRQSTHGRGVAGKRWRKRAQTTLRTFMPNLQKIAGQKLCADCISKLKKEGKITKPQIFKSV